MTAPDRSGAVADAVLDLLGRRGPATLLLGPGPAVELGIPPMPIDIRGPSAPGGGTWDAAWPALGPRMCAIHAAQPGPVHETIATLWRAGRIGSIIAEGDDLLLEEAGIGAVIELRGSARSSFCPSCGYAEPLGCLLNMLPLPVCAACSTTLRPGQRLAHEASEPAAMTAAAAGIARAGVVVVAGSPVTRDAAVLVEEARMAEIPVVVLEGDPLAALTSIALR